MAQGPSTRLSTAVEALARGDLQVALTAASKACHDAPDEPEPHYAYGQVWLALNQPARAWPSHRYRQPRRLHAHFRRSRRGRGAAPRDDRAGARRMERALGVIGPDATPEHAIMARFDLAKFWSGQGAHPDAFRQWRAGHALLGLTQPYSRADHAAFIDANRTLLDRARFADGPRASNRDPAPVFIVGMPRSGTTLCEQILAAQAHGAGERSDLGWAFAQLGGRIDDADSVANVAALDAPSLDRAADAYLSRCERDPRDIGLSSFTFRFHDWHPYAHDLADLGWTIARRIELMRHWNANLPNPVRTVSRAQVRQSVNARGLGRWKTYAAELAPLIAELDAAGALDGWD